jgi:hypothetical protein
MEAQNLPPLANQEPPLFLAEVLTALPLFANSKNPYNLHYDNSRPTFLLCIMNKSCSIKHY